MVSMHSLVKHIMTPVSVKSIRWAFDCSQWSPTPVEWLNCLKSIQPEERERINRFVFRNDAMSSIAGRLLMRKFLVQTGLSSWKTLHIARSAKGKPYVPRLDHMAFSVSHHGRLTVLAGEIFEQYNKEKVGVNSKIDSINVSDKTRIDGCTDNNTTEITSTNDLSFPTTHSAQIMPCLGIDICNQELPRNTRIPEFFRLMRRNFHEEEWRYILDPSDEATQLGRFYRLWSLKEAFVKATGTGITVPLNEICFRVASEVGEENAVIPQRNISVDDLENASKENHEDSQEDEFANSSGHEQIENPKKTRSEKREYTRTTCVTDTRVILQGQIRDDWKFEETQLMKKYCVAVALHRATPGSIDKGYEVVTFGDLQDWMENVEVNEDDEEELYHQAQEFVKKQLRPWH